jgi:hypothetical protein
MKRVTFIAIALLVAVLAVLSSRVTAQETNVQEVTYLTFSNTVEMPGVTLPAGTYMFRLADTPSRNVVQVLDRDGQSVKGQWLFVQSERPEVSGDTVIMFKENREGATPAIQYWYFPGEKIGKEFIYPKDQAQKIAARTGQQVRSEGGYVTAQSSSADAAALQGPEATNVVNGAGLPPENNAEPDTALRDAPASSQPTASAGSLTGNRGIDTTARHEAPESQTTAVGTSGSSTSEPVGTSGQAESQTARSNQLPKTASPLPISGLIGLLSFMGALGTRRAARK